MSKSRGNVVVPDEYIAKWGAEAIRGWLPLQAAFPRIAMISPHAITVPTFKHRNTRASGYAVRCSPIGEEVHVTVDEHRTLEARLQPLRHAGTTATTPSRSRSRRSRGRRTSRCRRHTAAPRRRPPPRARRRSARPAPPAAPRDPCSTSRSTLRYQSTSAARSVTAMSTPLIPTCAASVTPADALNATRFAGRPRRDRGAPSSSTRPARSVRRSGQPRSRRARRSRRSDTPHATLDPMARAIEHHGWKLLRCAQLAAGATAMASISIMRPGGASAPTSTIVSAGYGAVNQRSRSSTIFGKFAMSVR